MLTLKNGKSFFRLKNEGTRSRLTSSSWVKMTEIFDSGDDDEDTVDTSDHSPLREKGESVKGFGNVKIFQYPIWGPLRKIWHTYIFVNWDGTHILQKD